MGYTGERLWPRNLRVVWSASDSVADVSPPFRFVPFCVGPSSRLWNLELEGSSEKRCLDTAHAALAQQRFR